MLDVTEILLGLWIYPPLYARQLVPMMQGHQKFVYTIFESVIFTAHNFRIASHILWGGFEIL